MINIFIKIYVINKMDLEFESSIRVGNQEYDYNILKTYERDEMKKKRQLYNQRGYFPEIDYLSDEIIIEVFKMRKNSGLVLSNIYKYINGVRVSLEKYTEGVLVNSFSYNKNGVRHGWCTYVNKEGTFSCLYDNGIVIQHNPPIDEVKYNKYICQNVKMENTLRKDLIHMKRTSAVYYITYSNGAREELTKNMMNDIEKNDIFFYNIRTKNNLIDKSMM